MPHIVCACGCGWSGLVKGRGRYNPAGYCKQRVADRKRAKGTKSCACGAAICGRAQACSSCQNRRAGRVRVYRKVHHRTCTRVACQTPFQTTNNRREHCSEYCSRRAYREKYHGFTAGDWLELVAEGVIGAEFAVPKPAKEPAKPKAPGAPAPRVPCPHCGGACTRGRTRFLILIGRSAVQWKCKACRRHHQRYTDGTLHQPLDQRWVAQHTKISINGRDARPIRPHRRRAT